MLLDALLDELARGVPALPGAACRDAQEVFDSDDHAAAIAVCARCPARDSHCRPWILGLPPSRRPGGVVAGEVWPVPLAVDDAEVTVRDRITTLARRGPVTAELAAAQLGLDIRRVRIELSRHPLLVRVARGTYQLGAR